MTRRPVIATALLTGLGWGAAAPAFAQGTGKIPVTEDLKRLDRIEERLDATGSTRPTPPAPFGVRDPSGVPGFSGPPGPDGDSVNSYGPLPQGISGSDIR